MTGFKKTKGLYVAECARCGMLLKVSPKAIIPEIGVTGDATLLTCSKRQPAATSREDGGDEIAEDHAEGGDDG